MARIGVLHRDFRDRGGAEAVCMHVLGALSGQHQVSLLTMEEVDLAQLDSQFGTVTDDITVETLSLLGLPVRYLDRAFQRIFKGGKLGYAREARYVPINRAVKSELGRFDLLIVTSHELAADIPLIQYVHFPKFNREANPQVEVPTGPPFDVASSLMTALWQRTGFPGSFLANSEWTARIIKKVYEVDAEVVYPPIQVERFEPTIPDNNRFVIAGRIERDKRLLDAIEIIRRVHDHGFDVELEIVGPINDTVYVSEVREQAASLPYISLAGHLPFSDYVARLEQARYGLHCKPGEHFGMVIAEMVAAGALPFVPDTGGQTEIVNQHPALTYTSIDAAVNQICRVLAEPQLEQDLRTQLPGAERYSVDRFTDTIKSVVETELASAGSGHR